ncbi:MAG TPA: 3-phosphoglycerate dehydrogenase [Candidatus Fimisoma avicola]|uniref:3-phosphoglycerate dehydrogenase n=1 Tax=Candidatus Fimisoma avicola TaxID=2840826 RepID=A0A9D1L8D6_9FIRM|nr:3-phosphoglycerate dehydrogenase [Candidatus Fimisoma avicola]
MYKISTLNKISKVGLSHFDDRYIITDKIEDANGILVRSQDMHSMNFSGQLMAIARAGAGVNNIPLDACAEKGIVVFNTPGANANAVKELVLAGMFLAARHIPRALSWAASLTEGVGAAVEKGKSQFAGTEIMGKTLGIAGLGAIGKKVAASAAALGMNIVGYDPFFNGQVPQGVAMYDSLEEMLPLCDYVTIHIPATDSTKGMFNKDLFACFKDSAVLLNFSRDKLVNEVDLLVALESGKISVYVTDFPTDTLVGRDKVILLPHLGASTAEAEDNCASMAVEQIMDYFENGNIRNSVNFPAVDMGPIGDNARICILTEDMADPAGEVMKSISLGDTKIIRTESAVKGRFGYVLAEVDSPEAPSLVFYDKRILRSRSITR